MSYRRTPEGDSFSGLPEDTGNRWASATQNFLDKRLSRRTMVAATTAGLVAGLGLRPYLDRAWSVLLGSGEGISHEPIVTQTTPEKYKREVFGFLRLNQIEALGIKPEYIDFRALTTLACFDVTLDGAGNVDSADFGTYFKNPEVQQIIAKAREKETKVVLTVSQLENERWDEDRERVIPFEESPIKKLLDSSEAQDNAIAQIIEMAKRGQFDGVNMDLEYGRDPGSLYRNRLTRFMAKLSDRLREEIKGSSLSVSVYTRAGVDSMIYDAKDLATICDRIFMMAYGYEITGLATATAPLYKKEGWSVSQDVEALLEQVPAHQLIVGFPAYGPRYQVTEPYIGAPVVPGTRDYHTYSQYARLLENNPTVLQGRDEFSKTEWAARPLAANRWEMSIIGGLGYFKEWLDFVGQREGLGLGIWTLDHIAYENPDPEFWELILKKFHRDLANKSAETWTAAQDRKIDDSKIVSYSRIDQRWLQQARLQDLPIGSGEVTVATLLSTLTRDKVNPVQVAQLFKDKKLRHSEQGLMMRTGEKDVLTWLAREYGLQVSKLLDRSRPFVTESEQKAPFDYQEAKRQLNKKSLIVASNGDIIFIIKDVDSGQKTMTIIDPLDGQIKTVKEYDLGVLAYAYVVRSRK